MKTRPFGFLLFVLLIVVGGIAISRSGATRKGLGIYPEIFKFTASEDVIQSGEPVTISWATRGTESVTLDYGPENAPRDRIAHVAGLPIAGSMKMQPTETTVYKLACNTISDGSMCNPVQVVVEVRGSALNAKLN